MTKALTLVLGWLWPTLAGCTHHFGGTAVLVITQGGTYTGRYQSATSEMACVRVATTAPVVLEGCVLTGPGNLIEAGEGAHLTVRNCRGQGLPPTRDRQAPGRFLDVYKPRYLVIEHNLFMQTSGLVIDRWGGTVPADSVLHVRYNQARNLDGRWRNASGSSICSFLLLNTVQHLTDIDIAYNEVVNTPDQSLVEDNINLYNSSGTETSPLRVHHNFVRGAYPFPATAGQFTGSGLTTDGDAATADAATAYVEADHNQFVGTGNAGINIAAGHDIYFHDNRVVTSGTLPDGRRFNAGFAGLGVFNFYKQPASVFGRHRMANNAVGYVKWGAAAPLPDRQDLSTGACVPCTGTVHLPGPVTPATEAAEWTRWQHQLHRAGVRVGPQSATKSPND
jgi:hypothetical protein